MNQDHAFASLSRCGVMVLLISALGMTSTTPSRAAEIGRRVLTIQQLDTQQNLHTITLHAKATPVKSVLADLARQSGGMVDFMDAPERAIDVDVEKATFWEAVAAVEKAGQLTIGDDSYRTATLQVRGYDKPADPLTDQVGPFIVRLLSGSRTAMTSVNLLAAPPMDNTHQAQLLFGVRMDPRLQHPALPPSLRDVRVTDASGTNILRAPEPDHTGGPRGYRVFHGDQRLFEGRSSLFASSFTLPLDPAAKARQAAKVSGIVRLPVWSSMEEWTIDVTEKGTPASKQIDVLGKKATVSLEFGEKQGGSRDKITLTYTGPDLGLGQPNSDVASSVFVYATLTGANGVVARPEFVRTLGNGASPYGQQVDVSFRQGVQGFFPAKLTWKVPTELAFVEVPFEFTNVELP